MKKLYMVALVVGALSASTVQAAGWIPPSQRTPTLTATPTATPTITATVTISATFTLTRTITQTFTITPTITPTKTPTPAYVYPEISAPKIGPGRTLYNTSGMGLTLSYPWGLGDCGAGASASATSLTSTPINLTFTVGMSPESIPAYYGTLSIYLVNTGDSSAVAWVNNKPGAIENGTPGGMIVKAGEGGLLYAPSRSGLTLHLQGLTTTTSVTYAICVN